MFDEEQEGNDAEKVPDETIMEMINSKKGITSYQLGSQVSRKWTTGAGPRSSCVRDCPSELQFRAVEQVNLSPRSTGLLERESLASGRSSS
ncbi:IQ DOMAIN-CONTAINING PROTEIN IQM6 [Salix koriyanagi]|uniref:IQ DOMAIN-CONTAINING PROTEIN IQM6 n=1 Tax=Salix koriyanagi TaxID=2511006 RepID=A0A9Q0Q9U8_9ROSI|nr:IQ DOMAIN-CONTAINING PROTEIN IQM6 [Salix koriyanagi]